jgi:hypothetical protein
LQLKVFYMNILEIKNIIYEMSFYIPYISKLYQDKFIFMYIYLTKYIYVYIIFVSISNYICIHIVL